MSNPKHSARYFREAFEYVDGKLFWKERPLHHFNNIQDQQRMNSRHAGKEAGCEFKGYRGVLINRTRVATHTVIFAIHYGRIPKMVDHVDGNPLNNRIENLRQCNSLENNLNARLRKDSQSGVKGVSWSKACKKWVAYAKLNGAHKHLGTFDAIFDAVATRRSFANRHYGEFVNHGSRALEGK